ncbi:MAG: nucleotidyltransferase family protein [Candidatus Omnitrophota bacterium]
MKALILAAGYGTRLYPLTIDRPKPLVKVGGKTILERLLRKLEAIDLCDEVYIVTNDKFHDMVEKWMKGKSFSVNVSVINDLTKTNEDRLGAIGDINLVLQKKKPEDDVLIVAGDNLFEFSISDFLNRVKEAEKFGVALYDVKDIKLAQKYGIVALDGDSFIRGFQEKPDMPESTLASTGIYYFPRKKLSMLEEYMRTAMVKDAPGNFVKWLSEKEKVYGYVFEEGWYDIGDKNSLEKADIEYREKELGEI